MEKQCCKKTQLPSYTSPNNNETQQALPKTGNLRPSRPVTTTTNDNNATAEVAECCSGRTTCTGYGKVLNSRKAGLLVESGAVGNLAQRKLRLPPRTKKKLTPVDDDRTSQVSGAESRSRRLLCHHRFLCVKSGGGFEEVVTFLFKIC